MVFGRTGKTGRVRAALVGCTALIAGSVAGVAAASAQGKDLSDNSVKTLMNYAWAMTPPRFTTPEGKVIEVDKTKPQAVIVSIDVARDVVKVARLTAFAQMCDLAEEQTANYQTMMAREVAKKIWTDQQLLYISQLHLFTVMTLTGKVQVVEQDDKPVVVQEKKGTEKKVAKSCSETERGKVAEQIKGYINSAPALGSATGSTPAAAPASAQAPALAPAAKK
jgi:hypothetical protein